MIIPVMAPESESSLPEVPDILLPILFPVRVLLDPVLAEALIVLAPLAPLDELEPLLLLPLLPDPDLELDIWDSRPVPPDGYKVVPDDTFGVVNVFPN